MHAAAESHDPDHYKTDGIECIDALRAALGKEGFAAYCRGNIMKYTWRLGKKDAASSEAHKVVVYSQWLYDTLCDMPLTKGIK